MTSSSRWLTQLFYRVRHLSWLFIYIMFCIVSVIWHRPISNRSPPSAPILHNNLSHVTRSSRPDVKVQRTGSESQAAASRETNRKRSEETGNHWSDTSVNPTMYIHLMPSSIQPNKFGFDHMTHHDSFIMTHSLWWVLVMTHQDSHDLHF